ncbi:MAG: N-acetylmuramoyl-L-alanine amidase [Alphaproteobacteria bacterium]|nr:N-acetylmuramoyl-L-alanine amidase [Alphaproteobacteria bacterium]MCZ6764293.1 N-acetylmuramoyl-L-alanine amidase [Alphaproteobacteria bacterium]
MASWNRHNPGEPAVKYLAVTITSLGGAIALLVFFAATSLVAPGTGVAADPPNPPLAVSDIRLGLHPDATRFVLDMSDDLEPSIFGLADPYRVVVDLPQAEFALPVDKTNTGAGVIESIRYGLFRPGTSRVVLDLRGPVTVARQFVLPPDGDQPWRLVIDLASASHADFVATMARPVRGRDTRADPPIAQSGPPQGKPVIVIDAGHGGVDPGAIGPRGTHEKTIVLRYARALRDELVGTGRYDVVMTRDEDVFLSLRTRVQAARVARGDLFISLHTNSHSNSAVRGFSVYTLSERASDAQTAQLAEQENKADIIGGLDLEVYGDEVAGILIDFARTKTNEQSVAFARDAVVAEVGRSATMLTRPWRSAGFAVLKAPDVPSVLIELGYLTNRAEARLLADPAYSEKLVDGMRRSIDLYFRGEQRASRR